MKSLLPRGGWAGFALLTIALTAHAAEPRPLWDAPPPPKGFPKFKVQEIAADFKIGYAVHVCDVDGDSKDDIVVVDKERVVWYQNPTWKMRTITAGKAKPDNVCICSLDIDGDGKLDFVLGAGWKPFDTKTPGTLQWLRRKASLDDEWEMFPIPCDEPMVHRVKRRANPVLDREAFYLAPLMGRDATAKQNWMDGRPVNILLYEVPKKGEKVSWKPEIVSSRYQVVHNFCTPPVVTAMPIIASYDGIYSIKCKAAGETEDLKIHDANQRNPQGARGASEIAFSGEDMLATIEPWHGNQVVAYLAEPRQELKPVKFRRIVIDEQLRWGHAIAIAPMLHELDSGSVKSRFVIAGVRDNPNPMLGDKFTEKRGVRLYRCTDGKGEKWDRYILEDGGVAVEDLQVEDLNGDGKPDIIAVGRATGNCRIYWNQGE